MAEHLSTGDGGSQSAEEREIEQEIPIVNHVGENGNVNNFEERAIVEENGDQVQVSGNRPTSRRRNHGPDNVLRSYLSLNRSINKYFKKTIKT